MIQTGSRLVLPAPLDGCLDGCHTFAPGQAICLCGACSRTLETPAPRPRVHDGAVLHAQDGTRYRVSHLVHRAIQTRQADGRIVDTGMVLGKLTLTRVDRKVRGKAARKAAKRERRRARSRPIPAAAPGDVSALEWNGATDVRV